MTGRPGGSIDGRGVAPAVGKTLEIGIGVLVVALLASTLWGTVVPDYRTAAGAELADRALASAASTTEAAVPPAGAHVDATRTADLPATIRGATYEVAADGDALTLRHPHPEIGGNVPLPLPARVVSLTGRWRSTERFVVHASGNRSGVELVVGGSP